MSLSRIAMGAVFLIATPLTAITFMDWLDQKQSGESPSVGKALKRSGKILFNGILLGIAGASTCYGTMLILDEVVSNPIEIIEVSQ